MNVNEDDGIRQWILFGIYNRYGLLSISVDV